MRTERRDLLKRLSDAESHANKAEQDKRRAKSAICNESTELWQNTWDQNDVSQTLIFPTDKYAPFNNNESMSNTVMCCSVETSTGHCMPGIHTLGAIERGRTTQSIWIKGVGYTLVGLVSSESEKYHLRHKVHGSWEELSMMKIVAHADKEENGVVCTIEVDMIKKRARLYTSSNFSTRHLQLDQVWENLPDKVWVAVAFKRNSGREAVLMPCVRTA